MRPARSPSSFDVVIGRLELRPSEPHAERRVPGTVEAAAVRRDDPGEHRQRQHIDAAQRRGPVARRRTRPAARTRRADRRQRPRPSGARSSRRRVPQVTRVIALASPASALQAASASSPAPSWAGSKSAEISRSGRSSWRVPASRFEPGSPLRDVVVDQVVQRGPDHRDGHRPVDRLEVIEEVLDVVIERLEVAPAVGDGPRASRRKRYRLILIPLSELRHRWQKPLKTVRRPSTRSGS